MMGFCSFFKRKKKPILSTLALDSKLSSDLDLKLKKLFKNESLSLDQFLSNLEELLLTSDVSLNTTLFIIKSFKDQITKETSFKDLSLIIKSILLNILKDSPLVVEKDTLNIFFIFGINGVGKTTSIAKLVNYLKQQNYSIIVAAADTYRAAAPEQLKQWMDLQEIPLIYHEGKSKPSAVVYDAIDAALSRKKDVLLIDTAGRIHNREDLLQELEKLNKIISTKAPLARVHHLIVLDATTGQNALSQAQLFNEIIGIDGVILSKMDSSGKGGVALSLSFELNLPVVFRGFGEKMTDIAPFSPKEFVEFLTQF